MRVVLCLTFSTCGLPTIVNFSLGIRTPWAAYRRVAAGPAADLVVHRVRRVVRRRLVGVAVSQIDVGEVLKANQRPLPEEALT